MKSRCTAGTVWYVMNGYGMRYEINMYSNHGMVRGGWLWYAVGNGKNEV
jgi:hypothetical protein